MITIHNHSGVRIYAWKGDVTNTVADGGVLVAPWFETANIGDGTNSVSLTWPEYHDTRATVGVGLSVQHDPAYGPTASFVLGMGLGASVLAVALILSAVRGLFMHSAE